MSNSLGSQIIDFTPKTTIISAEVEANFQAIINRAPSWQVTTVAYSDFSAATTTGTINAFSLSAGASFFGVYVKHSTEFQGGGVSALDVSLGISTDTNKYTLPFDVFQTATGDTFDLSQVIGIENFDTASTLVLEAVATGGNLSDLTQGTLTVAILKNFTS